jgi:hypothetical protein
MHAEQVLDCQADLHTRVTSVPEFQSYLSHYIEVGQDEHGLIPQEQARQNVQQMLSGLGRATKMAEAFKVTASMTDMVMHFADLLDDTDLFMPDLAPSEYGMVFFEKPIPIADVRGRTMLAQWCIWGRCMAQTRGRGPVTPAVQVFWFNDHRIQPDAIAKELLALPEFAEFERFSGRWGLIGVDVFPMGREVGSPVVEASESYVERLAEEGVEAVAFTNPMRHLHALWMLLGQSISRMREEDIPRHAMKRAKRAGLMPRVTVIELRRSEGTRNTEPSPINWTSQWLVRSHMRWQPYGSRRCDDHTHEFGKVEVDMAHSVRFCVRPGCDHVLKRIAIPGHVKGPEGAPLRLKQHVYALRR